MSVKLLNSSFLLFNRLLFSQNILKPIFIFDLDLQEFPKKQCTSSSSNKQISYKIYNSVEEIDCDAIVDLLKEAVNLDQQNAGKSEKVKTISKYILYKNRNEYNFN